MSRPQPSDSDGGKRSHDVADRALFIAAGDGRYSATEYCRGPWGTGTLHGGAVAGLLGHVAEQASLDDAGDRSLACTRLTVEIFRPVPQATLEAAARIVRSGRRSQVIDVTIAVDGVLHARASTQWAALGVSPRPASGLEEVDSAPVLAPPPRPTFASDPRAGSEFDYPEPGFNCDTCELRYVKGSHETAGPGITWMRLISPVVASAENSPFVTAAALSDLAAAAGWEPSPMGASFINPDLTLQLARLPIGEWVAIESHVEHGTASTAALSAQLFDDTGPFGRVLQTLVESPIQLPTS